MQLDRNDKQLLEILNRAIREMEKVEDDPATMNFVARRVGNIVKHMKDLRDDLRPRGTHHGHPNGSTEKPYDGLRPSANSAIGFS
ncbi:MAG: hypothetical protein JST79_18555 [Acidobacteria bacterium]|jgi:hypothetical protein|nr:hypothetical protein [Acidobacteriota bacterium]